MSNIYRNLIVTAALLLFIVTASQAWPGQNDPTTTPKISITTVGTLRIIQQNPGTLQLTAVRQNSTSEIAWSISGAGENIVTNPAVATMVGDTSTVTIALDQTANGWTTWSSNADITVEAYLVTAPAVSTTTTVTLKKFSRDIYNGAGSLTFKVPLFTDSANGASSRGSYLVGHNPYVSPLSVLAATNASVNPPAITSVSPVDYHSSTWYLYYQSSNDVGRGNYRFNEIVDFTGDGSVSATYQGLWHNASYGTASAVTAGVSNAAVNLMDANATSAYSGFPASVSVGISAQGGSSASGGGSVSVNLTFSSQNSAYDSSSSTGHYTVAIAPMAHVPTQNVSVSRLVDVAAAVHLEQINDNEWKLQGGASITGTVPFIPQIEFMPEF